jgi:hypothetical protein
MGATAGPVWNCYRENIINAPENDWTEWQAGWVSGAIPMPASALRTWSAEYARKCRVHPPFPVKSPAGSGLINLVVERCDVSIVAAIVVVSVNWWKSNWHQPSTSEQLTRQLLMPPPFVN